MRKLCLSLLSLTALLATLPAAAQTNSPNNPTWWDKYQYLSKSGPMAGGGAPTSSVASDGNNVDVSNEGGPQSQTYITLHTPNARQLPGGSNDIFPPPIPPHPPSH